MNQHLCTVLLIIAVTSNCDDLVSALGCDELDHSSVYTVMCQGSTVTHTYCPPGKRLIYPCEGICNFCPTGQYQNKHNTCENCRNCTTQADCDRFEHILIRQCKSDTDAKCGCPTCPTCETCPTPPEPNIQPTQEDTTPVASCPPVEPCPSASPLPEKGSLSPHNNCVHKGWRIWGIISAVVCILLLLRYLILYIRLRKVPKPKGYADILMNQITNYDATLPEESGQGPSSLRGAEGGDPSLVATPPEGSGQGPNPLQVAEGGDPTPVNGDAAHRPLLEGNGATVPANPQGANDQQWQFEPEDLGDQHVDEHVLSILATRIFRNHGGKELSDVPYFCCQLGIPSTVYNPVCMDRKKSRTDELLHYVFLEWNMATSLTRNKLRKALFDFDQGNKTSLCKLYVKIVNDRFREDSSENS